MRKPTIIFIVLTLVVIAVYDVWTIYANGRDTSVSWQIILISYEYPIFSFLIGVTMGHLFWRMKDPTKDEGK